MKTDARESFRAAFEDASPMSHVRADAPPFFVIHGSADNLAPVGQAREFSAALREVSRSPVLYAEIPGASHAFDVFHSVRTSNVIHGVDVFLDQLVSGPMIRVLMIPDRQRAVPRRITRNRNGIERSDDHGAYGATSNPASVTSGTS